MSTVFCVLPTQAEIYRWVDDEGAVHYSDIKPNNRQTESIRTRSGTASADGGSDPVSRAREMEDQKQQQEEIAQRASQIEKDKAETLEKCDAIRENLKKIEENSRIRIEEEGKLRFLSAEEIIERKSGYQKLLDEFCRE
jgi:vacuolar-type H+-ATPase subunit I/STV1